MELYVQVLHTPIRLSTRYSESFILPQLGLRNLTVNRSDTQHADSLKQTATFNARWSKVGRKVKLTLCTNIKTFFFPLNVHRTMVRR